MFILCLKMLRLLRYNHLPKKTNTQAFQEILASDELIDRIPADLKNNLKNIKHSCVKINLLNNAAILIWSPNFDSSSISILLMCSFCANLLDPALSSLVENEVVLCYANSHFANLAVGNLH